MVCADSALQLFSTDQGTLLWGYFPTVGVWESAITDTVYSKLALSCMCNLEESCSKLVKVDYMDYALRVEDDKCVCWALFAGMFNSDCGLDFGFRAKERHGVYISIICRQHRVFLPNYSEERQHGSWIPGKYCIIFSLSYCLCVCLVQWQYNVFKGLNHFMSNWKTSERALDFGLACREIRKTYCCWRHPEINWRDKRYRCYRFCQNMLSFYLLSLLNFKCKIQIHIFATNSKVQLLSSLL